MHIYRMIDANINRVAEGIRVLEDITRFILEDTAATERLRELRHGVRKSYQNPDLIRYRDAAGDIGCTISENSPLDRKENLTDLVKSNFKRMQEGLRSIEESLKITGNYKESKIYESLRFKSYELEKSIQIAKLFLNTDIYAITGERFSAGRSNIKVVRELLDADVKIIQYREKEKNKKEKYEECLAIRCLTKEKGALFIVNDDIDIALAVSADGIHIGQEDMPLEEVRKITGNMLIGLSTHKPEQALEAVAKGADYIGVGPMFATQTKENIEPSEGLLYLKWVSENIRIPYVAIGGIKEDNIREAKSMGGKCFAMISEIVGAPFIKEKVQKIRDILAD